MYFKDDIHAAPILGSSQIVLRICDEWQLEVKVLLIFTDTIKLINTF